MTVPYDFQIANHNLVLADILSKNRRKNSSNSRKPLFPDCGAIIFDEAHKLLDTARQMYGMNFGDMELEQLAAHLYRAIGTQNTDRGEIVRLCRDMLRQNGLLFQSANCVIVKDFSRFGRNYVEAGDYIENLFPLLGVRFISINEENV